MNSLILEGLHIDKCNSSNLLFTQFIQVSFKSVYLAYKITACKQHLKKTLGDVPDE